MDSRETFRDHRELQLGAMGRRTVPEPKTWLRELKLPVRGKKVDMIARLTAELRNAAAGETDGSDNDPSDAPDSTNAAGPALHDPASQKIE